MIRQQSAWIMNGEAMTACQIMDISKRGAKIVPAGSSVVPARFELAFTPEDRKRQACEVGLAPWQDVGHQICQLAGLGRLLLPARLGLTRRLRGAGWRW